MARQTTGKRKNNKRQSSTQSAASTLRWKTKGYWADLVLALGYGLLTLVVALSISWVVLAKQNFIYGVWHDHAGIGAGIDEFGPQNRHKRGFGDTSRQERLRVFSEINLSVHRGGEGLGAIRYQSLSSHGAQKLLHSAEIIHLQDVANLIDVLFMAAVVAFLMWLGLGGYLVLAARRMPGIARQTQSLAIALLPVLLIMMVVGPKEVFNQFHIWIFPEDHEWFFFYQDSLMSTLMLAPNLFGWIALVLMGLATFIFVFLQFVLAFLARKFS